MNVVLTVTNVETRVNAEPAIKQKAIKELRARFRVENDIWLWKGKNGAPDKHWARYTYLVDAKGSFETGHLSRVSGFLKSLNYNVIVDNQRSLKDYDVKPRMITESLKATKALPDFVQERIDRFPFTPRPYQLEAVLRGLQTPRGTFVHATGTGKTLTIALLIAALDVPTVVLTGKKDLMYQLQSEISEYSGLSVGIVGDGKMDIQKITVMLVASVGGKNPKPEVIKALRDARYLAIDEKHHMQAGTWKKACSMATGAVYRHGFTATFMTSKIKVEVGDYEGEKLANNIYATQQKDHSILIGHTGPIIHTYSILDAIEDGYLCRPQVNRIANQFNVNKNALRGLTYHEAYDMHIVNNAERNAQAVHLISEEAKSGNQVIVFVKQIVHGMILREMLVEKSGLEDKEVQFVHGTDPGRMDKLEEFKNGKFQVLIGTSIIGEGLNFFCDVGINVSAGDSDKDAVQRLGRILRKKRTDSGDVDTGSSVGVRFYDFGDFGHYWFDSQSKSRFSTWSELGFTPQHMEINLTQEEIHNLTDDITFKPIKELEGEKEEDFTGWDF